MPMVCVPFPQIKTISSRMSNALQTLTTTSEVPIDWTKMPCIIITGSVTEDLRNAALKIVEDDNLKHCFVSDCHEEEQIRQICTECRNTIFEGDSMRFARTKPRYSASLYEFLAPRTSKLNCGTRHDSMQDLCRTQSDDRFCNSCKSSNQSLHN